MPVRTRRYNDPAESGDGLRVLVTRYRPRGVRREDETWDVWWPELGPSRELHAARYGKAGAPIDWPTYRTRYLDETASRPAFSWRVRDLVERVARGETVTLL